VLSAQETGAVETGADIQAPLPPGAAAIDWPAPPATPKEDGWSADRTGRTQAKIAGTPDHTAVSSGERHKRRASKLAAAIRPWLRTRKDRALSYPVTIAP